jgi:hypothetical protein
MPSSRYVPESVDESTAPWNQSSECQDNFYKCANCGKSAWQHEGETRIFEDRTYNDLTDAGITPNGHFACSLKCKSQLMFEAADDDQKEHLKKLVLALHEIYEYVDFYRELVEKWSEYTFCFDDLENAVRKTQQAIGVDAEPDWMFEDSSPASGDAEMLRIAQEEPAIAELLTVKAADSENTHHPDCRRFGIPSNQILPSCNCDEFEKGGAQ